MQFVLFLQLMVHILIVSCVYYRFAALIKYVYIYEFYDFHEVKKLGHLKSK